MDPDTYFAGRTDEIWTKNYIDIYWNLWTKDREHHIDTFLIGYEVSQDMGVERAIKWARS